MNGRSVGRGVPSCAGALALLFLLLPAPAAADRHKALFGGAFTHASGSSLDGIAFTAELLPSTGTSADPKQITVAVALDASQVAGKHREGDWLEDREVSRTAVLIGPRFAWYGPGGRTNRHWLQLYAHVLAGIGYERAAGREPLSSLAWSVGGGFDLIPVERYDWFVVRAQYGWHWLEGDLNQDHGQFTVGIAFRVE